MTVRIQYRNYPHAPKATQKSLLLGVMTTWVFLLLGCLAVHEIVALSLLCNGLGLSETASNLLGLAADGLFLYGMFRLKKQLTAKLDREASREADDWERNPEGAERRENARRKRVQTLILVTVGCGVFLLILIAFCH